MTDTHAGLWVCPNGCRRERITEPTTAYECADCAAEMVHASDDDDMVPREKYREALDKANKFKNMWHNTHQELEGYKKYQSVSNDNLRAVVEEMERYEDRDVDKFAAKLKELIEE